MEYLKVFRFDPLPNIYIFFMIASYIMMSFYLRSKCSDVLCNGKTNIEWSEK
jgi:hypothetical protein